MPQQIVKVSENQTVMNPNTETISLRAVDAAADDVEHPATQKTVGSTRSFVQSIKELDAAGRKLRRVPTNQSYSARTNVYNEFITSSPETYLQTGMF